MNIKGNFAPHSDGLVEREGSVTQLRNCQKLLAFTQTRLQKLSQQEELIFYFTLGEVCVFSLI